MQDFAMARKELMARLLDNSVAIIPAAKTQFRNANIEYLFRQDSNFYYLTGYDEPDAICVLIKDGHINNNKFILFSLPKSKEKETWTGVRIGQDDAKTIYHADESYELAQAAIIIPQLLKNKQAIYLPIGKDSNFTAKVITWLTLANTKITKEARKNGEKISYNANVLHNILPIIAELRLCKTEQELQKIRKAAAISSQSHLAVMHACQPGLYEYQLGSTFIANCIQQGCRSLAYPMIVASGHNACILHYTQNNKQLQDGELVLVDAGGEYKYYAADITRTIPVSGKFNEAQKVIYNLVLQAQLAGLAEIKPGNVFAKAQQVVIHTLVKGLVAIDILHGDIDDLIKAKAYKKFYMHNASHWLGLDVHDVGDYYQAGEYRAFLPGMVLTIEPGLYIAADCEVAEQWRGIGVRIEDIVLVTATGYEVITKDLPKTVAEIEYTMQKNNIV